MAWLRRFEHAKRTPNYKARGGQTYSLRNPEHSRIAVDASGDFVVGTTHRGTIDFGAGALVNDSVIAFAIAKISPDGKTKWSRQLKPTKSVRAIAAEVRAIPGGTSIRDLVIDRAGNIVMAGEYSRYVGGLPRGSKKRTPRYVAWFSGTDGKLLRAATLGETPPITVNGILPLDDGSVVLSGFHSGLYDFGNPGAVAVKLDAKGKETWRHRLMDSGRSAWVSDAVVKEDGSYLLLGGRYAEGYNMWFGKLAADGTPPTELVHTLTQVNPATERALTNDLVIDDEGRGLTMGAI